MPKYATSSGGATLVEALLSLSLLIIISSYAIPQIAQLKAYFESRSVQQSLLTYLSSARSRALYHQEIITVCPLADNISCTSDWNTSLSIFVDSNSNAILDADEFLISNWNGKGESVNLTWILNRAYIRFRPNGSTTATTGSLRYCYPSMFNKFDFRLVIARTGRIRVDRNEPGCTH